MVELSLGAARRSAKCYMIRYGTDDIFGGAIWTSAVSNDIWAYPGFAQLDPASPRFDARGAA